MQKSLPVVKNGMIHLQGFSKLLSRLCFYNFNVEKFRLFIVKLVKVSLFTWTLRPKTQPTLTFSALHRTVSKRCITQLT